MLNHEDKIKEYLSEPGGPFYELQTKLGLIQENAFRAEKRAVVFVFICWVIPMFLALFAGKAWGPIEKEPYLLELGLWARFFIAVGLFILMEKRTEERLRVVLGQFFKIPILATTSLEPAAEAINNALRKRESKAAECVCIGLAIIISIMTYFRLSGLEEHSWAIRMTSDGASLSYAAWWLLFVSNPVFWFLLFRWLWRHHIFAQLLRDFAKLELRIVVTHPDNNGGLAFIGEYPNAYAMFVFAISCVLGASIAHEFVTLGLTPATFGYIMSGWLFIVFALFSYPLLAFWEPLTDLKKETLLKCGAQATRFHRALEREVLGENVTTVSDDEDAPSSEFPNPTPEYMAATKMSAVLFNRLGLLPVAAAAVLPLFAAACTQLPVAEMFKMVRKLLLF